MTRPLPARARAVLRIAPATLTALLVLGWTAAAALAQDPHANVGGTPADVPSGDGTIRVRVIHPDDPARAAGLEVALYALAPDGTPGLRSGSTDDDGEVLFEGVSPAADVVYLVGARYRDIPFGRRAAFGPGAKAIEVEIEVNDPLTDASAIHVTGSEWRLQWVGSELWVHETHTLESGADRVVQVPEAARQGARPAFTGSLPEGASGFSPALGSFSQGLERDGQTLRFWGPVYPGTQEVRYQYRLPLTDDPDGETLEVRGEWPSGTDDLTLWIPVSGPEVEVVGRDLESRESVERDDLSYRVLDAGSLAEGAHLDLAIRVPPASHDIERLRITRADLWVDLDDVAAVISQEIGLSIADGSRLAGSPEEPLLHFELPPGAQLLGASQNATTIGLGASEADGAAGLDVVGPLTPGETRFGFRYRLPVPDHDGPLTLPVRWPREVDVMNVLVADIGLVVEDSRLHRMRPIRSGTRTYIHREGFQVEPDESLEIHISRIERPVTPLWASLGGTLLLGALGAGFLLQPLRRSDGAAGSDAPVDDSAIAREREGVVESLRDLDHDHETGKISDADYEGLRTQMRARALELMRLERTGTEPAQAPAQPATRAGALHCTACGARAESAWRFCAGCGAPLATVPANSSEGEAAVGSAPKDDA